MVRYSTVFCTLLLAAAFAVAAQGESDVEQIRRADAEMVAALHAGDVDRWLSYFADDGAMWPHCEPRVVGKDAVREYIQGFLTMPTFAVVHNIESIVVGSGGDLAYVTYTYQMGDPVVEEGKDLTIYRKNSAGEWKLVIDMWSTDAAPCQ